MAAAPKAPRDLQGELYKTLKVRERMRGG